MSEDDFNALAWRDFLVFSLGSPEMRRAFTEATGLAFGATTRSPIELLVDAATGADKVIDAFVRWVTVEHWGIEHAPKAYQRAVNGVCEVL